MKTKSGKSIGSEYGSCNVIDIDNFSTTMKIWSDVWSRVKNKIVEGKPIRAVCRVNLWNDSYSLVLDRIEAIG